MLGSKKALVEVVLQPLFVTVLVLGMLFILILGKVIALGSDTSYDQKFQTMDLGVGIGAVHNIHSHANGYLLFKNSLNFSYAVEPQSIYVFKGDKREKDSNSVVSYFVEDGFPGLAVYYKDLIPKNNIISRIYVMKKGNSLIVDSPIVNKDLNLNLKTLPCPQVQSEDLGEISIDPGHGFDSGTGKGSKGFVNAQMNWTESGLNILFATMLKKIGPSTRGYSDVDMPMAERITNIKNSVISIHIGSEDDFSANNAVAYYNANSIKREQSKKLGCLILNALSDDIKEITGIALVPVNVQLETKIDPESPFAILQKDRIAIMLEIGNIKNPLSNMIADPPKQRKIVDSISTGVNKYQGT